MVPSAFFCWFSERATPSVMTPLTMTSATATASPEPIMTVTEVRRPGAAATVWVAVGRPM